MTTERRNPRSVDIDLIPIERVLKIINAEDALAAGAVAAAIPNIAKVVELAVNAIRTGGRVIYVGAGTSGRIAALDAAECPPTFSAPVEWVQAVMAGGAKALTRSIEGGEDDREKAASDLKWKKLTLWVRTRNNTLRSIVHQLNGSMFFTQPAENLMDRLMRCGHGADEQTDSVSIGIGERLRANIA